MENQAPETEKQKMFYEKDMQELYAPIRASAQFFGLPELIEMTLLHVPALQILVIQRTNKMFHDTVGSSVSIQRKLFLQNDPHKDDISRIESNLFLQNLEMKWFYASTRRILGGILTTDLKSHSCPTASWRYMLLSMPTSDRLAISRYNKVHCWGQTAVLVASEKGGGVRMGQLADHVWEDEEGLSTQMQMEVKA